MNNVCYDLHVIIFDVILDKMLLLLQQISVYSLVKGVHCVCVRVCLCMLCLCAGGYVRGCLPVQPSAYVCPSVRV